MDRNRQIITCINAQIDELKAIAESRTAGIWRIKRAKVILGTLEGKSVDRLVLDVRVPTESIKKCLKSFASIGLKYFKTPIRKPTLREKMMGKIHLHLSPLQKFQKDTLHYLMGLETSIGLLVYSNFLWGRYGTWHEPDIWKLKNVVN